MSKYIDFQFVAESETGKTKVFEVRSRRRDAPLGWVYWYGAWRQYVFEPKLHTVWSCGCLDDISAFLRQTNDAHRVQAGCALLKGSANE